MKRLLRACIFSLCILLFVSVLLFPSPAEAGIYNSDSEVTYKEYWIPHSEFTGQCGSSTGNQWYLEPWPNCTKTLEFEIPDDFSQALKVEIYIDLWRNHDELGARFSLNGGPTHTPDVGYDWSRTPYIGEIPKSELVQGTNTIDFWSSRGIHIHDVAFRIYYDQNNPLIAGSGSDVIPPDGALTLIGASNGTFFPGDGGTLIVDNDQVTLNATASGGDVKFVEFHAYYDGYDEDNDGVFLDWHNLGRNNFHPGGTSPKPKGGTIDHIGTDINSPYSATWNLPHIANQSGVRFKIRIVDNAGNVREAAGGVSAAFTLSRTDVVIQTYLIPEFRDAVLHHGGTHSDTVTRFINLPNDLSNITGAYIIGAYWRDPYIEINDNPQFEAFSSTPLAQNDTWALSVKEFPVSYLQSGQNRIDYAYSGSGFGEFIEKPGPMIVLRGTGSILPPVIDVWYGTNQEFGNVSTPQQWVNILGNVTDPDDGVASLVYSLNGEPELTLSMGPDDRRLAMPGDFNIDIDRADLINGANQVVITATDNFSNTTVETVTVQYTNNTQPLPYSIDWSSVSNIQDVAQVVDGKWEITGDGVQPVEPGYNRPIAIGDLTWADYEVEVPITIHGFDLPTGPNSGEPGLGLLMRWEGHTDNPISGWQPKSGWLPNGQIGWWRWNASATAANLEFYETSENQSFTPALETTYIFKMRVESTSELGGLYKLKVWEEGQAEPGSWDLSYQAGAGDLGNGSFLLLAHHVDASFGDVTVSSVTPLSDPTNTVWIPLVLNNTFAKN